MLIYDCLIADAF